MKQVGARTVWCASTARATEAEQREAFEVCRALAPEAPAAAAAP